MAHLLRWVTTAVRELPAPTPLIPPPPPPTLLLLGGEPDAEATLRQAMTAALGADWALDTQPLSAAATLNPALYGVIVILQHTFSTRNSVRDALAQVLAAAPCRARKSSCVVMGATNCALLFYILPIIILFACLI